jgi:hypothetical protein
VSIPEQPFGKNVQIPKAISRIMTAQAVLPTPSKTGGAIVAARLLTDPNPTARREHAATALAVLVIGPIVESRPCSGEKEVPPKTEAMKAAVVKMGEVAADERVTGEAVSCDRDRRSQDC